MTHPEVTGNSPSTLTSSALPTAPAVTEDPLLDTLPGAIVAGQESSVILRVGVVVHISEGTQVTVQISGSDVLVNCAYQFPVYLPLLGDRVVVLKQDSQWFCIGQMTGPISSNNPLPNPSFEDSDYGTVPSFWSMTVTSAAGGTPTFTVDATATTTVSGIKSARINLLGAANATSTADVYSTTIGTAGGAQWTAAYFLVQAVLETTPPRLSAITLNIEFLDIGGAVLTSTLVNTLTVHAGVVGPSYRRLSSILIPAGFVAAPQNATGVRLRIGIEFRVQTGQTTAFLIDNAILRQVG